MELRQLKYFVAVAEELNFTRAAKRCHIAQPPLSQQIKKLEEELETKLFDRTNRAVSLTKEGKSFLCVARNTLDTLECGVSKIKSIARGEIGILRIGFLNSAIQTRFPEALTEFRKRHPGIKLEIQDMESRILKRAILDDELDVGICHHKESDSETLKFRIFLNDPYFLAVHKDHRFVEKGTAGWKDLDGEPFIMFSRENYPNSYERSIARFNERGTRPKIIQEAQTQQTKLSLIAAGMGMGFVPSRMKSVCPACVRMLPFQWDGVSPNSALKVAWKHGEISTALQLFLDVLDEYRDTSNDHLVECWSFTCGK
jgi:DNA-binding transcriptional LysR family regulator